ncbi:transcription factor [Klebsormidium nitens]|uniref:Transcription factor n=1 Tax=Klebsormidium nitens TaxID=105231 RepID=A0A1Y1I3U2_KLENI|nr:transcription factor [Klebsormidium nitens]|eukprot:GAQ82768.1 transcription factor [Klebsormidium nitens]
MYAYPFQREGNVKEQLQSMLNTSGGAGLDVANAGRPFASPYAPAQSQGANSGPFHHGGNLPSLHNIQGSFNMQNMPSGLPSRNPGLPSAAQQQVGGGIGGRFGGGQLPGTLQQIPHTGMHGHNALASRTGLGTGANASMNGLGRGLNVGAPQLGAGLNRLGAPGSSVSGGALNVGASNTVGGGVGLNRTIANAGLNAPGLTGSRSASSSGPSLPSGAAIQAPGRPAAPGTSVLQQNAPSSSFNSSDSLLAMINRGMQSQAPSANGQLSNLAKEERGGESIAFDLDDFPSLSTRPTSGGSGALQGVAGALRKAAAANVIQQHQEFSIQNEDFPALPGFKAGGEIGSELHHKEHQHDNLVQNQHFGLGRSGGFPLGTSYLHQQQQQQGGGLGGVSRPGGAGLSQYDQLVSQHHFQQQQAQLRSGLNQEGSAKDGGQKSIQGSSDRFGLLGLLSVIRMSDPDLTTLALGTDLTTLGLNLNSRENLYKTFASPWADGPVRGEPEFTLPACYVQPAPRLQPGYFSKFQQDTLFYIFYSMPHDEAQLYAADELSNRGWWFHKDLQMWLMRVPNTETVVKTSTFERGSYYFFDPTVWETTRKENFVLQYELLEARPQLPAQR